MTTLIIAVLIYWILTPIRERVYTAIEMKRMRTRQRKSFEKLGARNPYA